LREGTRAKKSLGQNFLVDGNVVSRIIAAAGLCSDDAVLEIGPGRGALTARLAAAAGQVVAVERDRDLLPLLHEKLSGVSNVEVIRGDILRVDIRQLLSERRDARWKVVANLPYNISSQILFAFIECRTAVSQMVLMLQKEVGDRLVALPGCKDYGILTVLCANYFDIEKLCIVKPGSFRPVPKVDSAVLRFHVLQSPRADVGDEELFRGIVKASFGQRRKTLANCLRGLPVLAADGLLEQVLCRACIDGRRRGETLSLDEFARLSREMAALQ
jgi:16S rRNA (adenine1518-N6/adenine1519-N6)-dimethyltransferase